MRSFGLGLSAAIMGVGVAAIVCPQRAMATLSPSDISKIAKQITVLIRGQETGSGVIIKREGDTYYVLTAKHVVVTEDDYTIFTPDGKEYPLNYRTVRKLPGVDLAVVQFTSKQNYSIAKLGNSNTASEGSTIYVAGFPRAGEAIDRPVYQFTTGQVTGNASSAFNDGYAIVYDNKTLPGMSGGSVLDENGQLIAIHGRADGTREERQTVTVIIKSGFNLGVPINTFLKLSSQSGVEIAASQSDVASSAKLPSQSEIKIAFSRSNTPSNPGNERSRTQGLNEGQAIKKLNSIPVFVIADGKGNPLLGKLPSEDKQILLFFLNPDDAKAMYHKIASVNPSLGSKARIVVRSLPEAIQIIKNNQNGKIAFQIVPSKTSINAAHRISSSDRIPNLPVFFASGNNGESDQLMTIEQNGKQQVPFFFELEDLQRLLSRNGQVNVEIKVTSLLQVIDSMVTKNNKPNPDAEKFTFVPSSAAFNFVTGN